MTYTIIDIETSGLNRELNNILEVGYIITNNNCELIRHGSFYFYKPEWDLGPTHIHNLSRDFLEKYQDEFNTNLAKLYTLMYGGLIIGKHSDVFDIPFIQSFIRRYANGVQPIRYYGTLDMENVLGVHYREWYKNVYGQVLSARKKGTLTELITMIGKTQEEVEQEFKEKFPSESRARAHSALYDVYMTYLLLVYSKENGLVELNY